MFPCARLVVFPSKDKEIDQSSGNTKDDQWNTILFSTQSTRFTHSNHQSNEWACTARQRWSPGDLLRVCTRAVRESNPDCVEKVTTVSLTRSVDNALVLHRLGFTPRASLVDEIPGLILRFPELERFLGGVKKDLSTNMELQNFLKLRYLNKIFLAPFMSRSIVNLQDGHLNILAPPKRL